MSDTAKQTAQGGIREYVASKNSSTALRLLSYFRFQKGLTAAALSLALLCNIAKIAQPYILQIVIDDYITPGIYSLKILIIFGLLYLSMVIAANAGDYAQTLVTTKLGQLIIHRLRTSLFSHVQSLGMGFFDRNSSGKLLTRINNDIESLSDLYTSKLLIIIKNTLLIIGTVVAMFSMDTKLALWCMWSIPVFILYFVFYSVVVRNNFMKVKAQISKINSFLAENIIGMKIVQLYAREKEKLREFHEMGRRNYQLGLREVILSGLSYPFIINVSQIMIALLIFFFAASIKQGLIELGIVYAFTTYLKELFHPIADIADQYSSIQSALISGDRIFDLLDNNDYLEDMTEGIRISELRGDIEFDHVWFAYHGEDYVLKDVSFKIHAGQRCAFVGATGSGKSTIISLIARFYGIQKGKIRIDGIDIKEYNLADLRRCIAVVMQDVFLFSGDIRYNIKLNNENISDEEIGQITKSIDANGFFEGMEDGMDHVVAERGMTFSAGERQLIAFARAVTFKPSILVLDEATANIDTKTETAIQEALDFASQGRTVIIIAHRLATIVNADVIFVMHIGRLVQSGTHADMYAEGGIYKKLYDLSCGAQPEGKKAHSCHN